MNRHGNFGCGPDIKKSHPSSPDVIWVNVDSKYSDPDVRLWDMTSEPPEQFVEWFDFILVNHVMCTMNEYLVHKALINIHRCLKPGATLHIIDMDLLKVFKSYEDGRVKDIPIDEGSIDDRLCLAISGYGTRDSLYTPARMRDVLTSAGFRIVKEVTDGSPYDHRKKESLIFEAIK